jgi:hypothetical protein
LELCFFLPEKLTVQVISSYSWFIQQPVKFAIRALVDCSDNLSSQL